MLERWRRRSGSQSCTTVTADRRSRAGIEQKSCCRIFSKEVLPIIMRINFVFHRVRQFPYRPPNFGSIRPPSLVAPRQKPLANERPHSPNLDPQHPTHPAPPTEQTGDLNAASVQGLERCRLDESQRPTIAFPLLSSTKNAFSRLFKPFQDAVQA